MQWFVDFLRDQPIAAVFLALALGNLVGRIGVRGLQLGSVPGTLIVGVLVGQLDIPISGEHKIFFLFLFLFATGYSVGPRFFSGLRKDGARLALFSFLLCTISVCTAYAAAVFMGWDAGTGAGLLAGGTTTSPLVGIATDALKGAVTDPAELDRMTSNVAMGYAVTYLFGAAGTAYFLVTIGFRMLDRDMVARCREYEKELGGAEPGAVSAYQHWAIRAHRIERLPEGLTGITIERLEALLTARELPARVMRVRDGAGLHGPRPDRELRPGDAVALSLPLRCVIDIAGLLGPEVVDRELLDFPISMRRAVVTDARWIHQPLKLLRDRPEFRGLGLRRIIRSGVELPVLPESVLEREDIVELIGTHEQVEGILPLIGRPEADGVTTDIPFLAGTIFLGLCAGALQLVLSGVPITLGAAGGVLVLGLVAGWLHTRVPRIGAIPEASVSLLHRLGLELFIAIVGITSSAGFVIGLEQTGLQLFLAGALVSLLPAVLGLLLGRYVFKFHPAIALGATCGSRTEAAALAVVQNALKSRTPALGFTVPFAVANVVLATLAILMVHLLL